MREKWIVTLEKMRACPEAIRWARNYPSLQAAWDVCTRGDWMWWLLMTPSAKVKGKLLSQIVRACQKVVAGELVFLMFRYTLPISSWPKTSAAYADIIRRHCPEAPKLEV